MPHVEQELLISRAAEFSPSIPHVEQELLISRAAEVGPSIPHVEQELLISSVAEFSPRIPHVEQELLISRAAEFSPRIPHVEQELLILPQHLSLAPVFSGVRVARFLAFYVMHCVLSPSIYGFWLPPLVSSNSSYREDQDSQM